MEFNLPKRLFFSKERKKVINIMRISLFILFVSAFQLYAVNSYGQEAKLNIKSSGVSLPQLFSTIEKQSEFLFFYVDKDVENVFANVDATGKSIQNVLDQALKNTALTYSISDRHVTILNKEARAQQQSRTISGVVTDQNGETIIGANIVIKNTGQGTVTDMDGKYSLSVPSDNAILVFTYVGFQPQEIVVGSRRTINVTMKDNSQEIDELVVTALGMKRSEKALGYATQKVGGEAFEKVKGVNVATSLSGRISGLMVFNSSEFMEAPSIKLRGENPLLVLDGVPTALTLGDLNSDDILDIQVLKGATASALYGSRGGSGAIMITTKKGAAGKKGFGITVNSSNMFNAGTLAIPKVQTSYSAGYGGKYNTDDEVWGDKLDIGRVYSQWDPIAKEYRDMPLTSKGKNNFNNFLELSLISNTTVSVTQQGENGSIRSSFSYVYNKGQYPNAKAQQFRYTLGGEMKIGDKITAEGTLAYSKQIAPNTVGQGYGNQGYIYNLLVWTGPEYDIREYKDYWVQKDVEQNWHYAGWYDNPYLMAYEKLNTVDNNKTNGMFSVNYQATPWLKAMVRTGMDLYINLTQKQAPLGINSQRFWGGTDKGYYMEQDNYGYTINSDLLLMADQRFGDFSVEGLLGGSMYLYNTKSQEVGTKDGLSIPGFYSLKASVNGYAVSVSNYRKRVNSLFGKLTLGYKSTFYLDITGRNDWSSTLPTDDNAYFYPSVGGSVIMSELIQLPEWMNFWKLRGSWTVSKNDLAIYDINQAYSISNSVWNGLNSAEYPTYLRGNVKPITNRTYEVGTAVHFLNNRLNLDLSYYNKLTYNNTTKVNVSPLSGYRQLLINTDEEYVMKGVEITLNATPVQNKDFRWDATFNWGLARRYYAKLDEKYSPDKLWVYEGARYDPYTAREFQRDPQGNLILFNGFLKRSDYDSKIGNTDPDWMWGLTNSFKYKNLTLSVSVDGRVGGLSNSTTNRSMWQTGAHPDSDTQYRYEEVVNGNKTFVADGVKIVSGSATYDAYGRIVSDTRVFEKNTQVVSYESYIKGEWRQGPQLILDETFIKLRELSLNYDVPKKLAGKLGMQNASVAFVGQNLLLWTKEYKFADPDKASDDLASPSIRYVGVNLKVEF